MTFVLFTTTFTQFKPEMGTPVRSSNGYPRFGLKYDLTHAAPETFPPRAIMSEPRPVFEAKYRDHLDHIGVDRLTTVFDDLAVKGGDDRLVLLCFEKFGDLKKPDVYCHRTLFGEWWQERTGQPVREIGPPPNGKSPYRLDPLW